MPIVIKEFPMYISKSSLHDGVMKWSAVNSDTDWDLYGERMSSELYHKMLSYIEQKVEPPDHFKSMVTSDYWHGGMPYLSIAHYPDNNGKAVPGQPLELFIDGTQLKAKGILFDTPLGRAVWKSLKLDEIKTKSNTDNDRIRISIAFLDLAHKHGETGDIFVRDSFTATCPECKAGVGSKIYVDGYLVHLALTRVPVNPRTLMEPEDIMAKKSQIQTRKEDALSILGDESLVDAIEKSALETKSEVLIEMSDTEDALVEDAKAKKPESADNEDDPTDPAEDTAEGETQPEDDPKKTGKKPMMKSLTEEDVVTIVKAVVTELAKPYEDKTAKETHSKDASADLEDGSPKDKKKKAQVDAVAKSALDLATDDLYNAVSTAISMKGVTLETRLESVNPALQELGNSISALVRESMGQVAQAPIANDSGLVLEAVTTLAETVKALATEVAAMKAQTPSVITANRVPVPRSIQPQLVAQSQAQSVVNPNSIANISRRSVSSQLPLK